MISTKNLKKVDLRFTKVVEVLKVYKPVSWQLAESQESMASSQRRPSKADAQRHTEERISSDTARSEDNSAKLRGLVCKDPKIKLLRRTFFPARFWTF